MKKIKAIISYVLVLAMLLGVVSVGGAQVVNAVDFDEDLTTFLAVIAQQSTADRTNIIEMMTSYDDILSLYRFSLESSQIATASASIANYTLQDSSLFSSKIEPERITNALTDLQAAFSTGTSSHRLYINTALTALTEPMKSYTGLHSNPLISQIESKTYSYVLFLNVLDYIKREYLNGNKYPLYYVNNSTVRISDELKTTIEEIKTGLAPLPDNIENAIVGKLDGVLSIIETNYLVDVNGWSSSSDKSEFVADLENNQLLERKTISSGGGSTGGDTGGSATPTATPTPTPIVTPTPAAPVKDALKDAEGILNAGGPVDADKIGAAMDNLSSALADSKKADDATKVAVVKAAVDQVVKKLSTVVGQASTEADKEAIADSATKVVTAILETTANVTTKEGVKELLSTLKEVKSELKGISRTIASEDKKTDLSLQESKIDTALKAAADSAVANAGKQEVAVKVVGDKAAVALDSAAVKELADKAKAAVDTAKELQGALKDNGINKAVEQKVVVAVAADKEAKNVTVELPADALKAVEANGVTKIEVNAGFASVEVSTSFTSEAANAKSVTLEVNKVEVNEALNKTLSEDQKALVESGATVIDLNAAVKDQSGKEKKVSQFDEKVKVKVPYALKEGESTENITILYLADDGTVKNMSGKYDAATGTVVFETDHFSVYLVKELFVEFNDVESSFWAANAIEVMASKGIINGRAPGQYEPQSTVTRAEFAKLVTTALNIVDSEAAVDFEDVNESDWFYSYVATAVNAGLIEGRSAEKFEPNAPITREEMAVLVANALVNVKGEAPAVSVDSKIARFTDKFFISAEAYDEIATAVQYGLLRGKPGNKIDPDGFLTRAEAATVIYRLYNL